MSIRSPRQHAHPEDARIRVQLDELIALRLRVARRGRLAVAPPTLAPGDHAGRRRGRGMDYVESRAYLAGDDVRHLDWRLTARSGQLHTKVFQEEYEQRLMLLLDCHASMRFGTRERFKSVQAARLAAVLAWHAASAGSRVGALAFGPCRQVQVARAGRRGALAVCNALARWDAAARDASAEPLSVALKRMGPLLRGASHVVLITDGRDADGQASAALALCRRHVHLSVLLVTDPLESSTLPRGRFPLVCAEQRVTVNLLDARARQQFHTVLAAPAQRLYAACAALGVACQPLDTCSDPLDAVGVLAGTAHRRSR